MKKQKYIQLDNLVLCLNSITSIKLNRDREDMLFVFYVWIGSERYRFGYGSLEKRNDMYTKLINALESNFGKII